MPNPSIEQNWEFFTTRFLDHGKVIYSWLRGAETELPSPAVNNFGTPIRGAKHAEKTAKLQTKNEEANELAAIERKKRKGILSYEF